MAVALILVIARPVPLTARPRAVAQRGVIKPRHFLPTERGGRLAANGDEQELLWSRSGITSTAGGTDAMPCTPWPWLEGLLIWHPEKHDAVVWEPCFLNRSDIGEPTPASAPPQVEAQPTPSDRPMLFISSTRPVLLVEEGETDPLVAAVQIENRGGGAMTWSATVLPESSVVPTLSALYGRQGQALRVQIDPSNLDVGVYTASLRIRGLPTTTRDAPQQVKVEVRVVRELERFYLPILMRQLPMSVVPQATPTSVAPQANPTPIAPLLGDPHGPSKIGFHAIGSGGVLETVRRVRAEGAHVAVVKGLSFGYLCEVKRLSPETVTVGRWSDTAWEAVTAVGDPAAQAAKHMDVHMDRWAGYEECVDYWEILNEVDPPSIEGHVWLAEFFKAAMEIAEAEGYRLALFSYSMGVPEIYEWEAIAETGVFAQAQAGGHVLALHEYGGPLMTSEWGETLPTYPGQDPEDPSLPRYRDRGALAGRYRHLYRDILIPRGEVIPLVISEANVGTYDPEERAEVFLDQIAWYDDRLREDDYVLGMVIFTLGGVGIGWDHFDYAEFLPELADRIIALQPQLQKRNRQ